MENSLLVGDFLLGLKFIYGAPVVPFSYTKLPGVTSPKPGDVVIFKYPGSDAKDYIKRCVAGPGQTIEIKQKGVFVDDKKITLAPRGKYLNNGILAREMMNYRKLRIPAKGDIIHPDTLPVREFLFCKHLIHQENPELSLSYRFQGTPFLRNIFPFKRGKERVVMKFAVYLDGKLHHNVDISNFEDNWLNIKYQLDLVQNNLLNEYISSKAAPDSLSDSSEAIVPEIRFEKEIFLDGEKVTTYTVKNDNYFMMGDNRDNSMDSRFWGYLNQRFVKAKAFILYFSLAQFYENRDGSEKLFDATVIKYPSGKPVTQNDDPQQLINAIIYIRKNGYQSQWNTEGELVAGKRRVIPLFFLPMKIRYNRIGKLIRGWDGLEKK